MTLAIIMVLQTIIRVLIFNVCAIFGVEAFTVKLLAFNKKNRVQVPAALLD
jgi:hypothetical protein